MQPEIGQIVRVRSRQYLVEDVKQPPEPGDDTLVDLSCLEDDAQGEKVSVLWEREVDACVLSSNPWEGVVNRGFDEPGPFSAYLHTLRWNCVTSTNPELFQAPHRAGIQINAYQLEPLRKALQLPRVNLFIADDVGLGKTIEAGLILREMVMRQKIKRVVIAAPPSVTLQWRDEMEQRFGLTFVLLDREYVARCQRERGFAVNPWRTHSRFIVSHALLRNETYAGSLRDWLDEFPSGSLLILDEAHNAAPSSSSKYAVDSHFTRAIRDLAHRFEHRLFLSATPHNGHSNSFAALLELLDPQRFCRGVPIEGAEGKKLLKTVMVRRLKSELQSEVEGFPDRKVVTIVIDGLPDSAPDLRLSHLLQLYRDAREKRLAGETRAKKRAAMLVVTSLQKRLLSSIDAFARTLAKHREGMIKKAAETEPASRSPKRDVNLSLLAESAGADDEHAERPEDEVCREEDAQMAAATAMTADGAPGAMDAELALLEEMTDVAETARHQANPKLQALIDWIRENQCKGLPLDGEPIDGPPPKWEDRRVLIFTEYADTKNYLQRQLERVIEGTDRADERIVTYHGGITDEKKRDAIKKAFNSDPKKNPIRILLATDAAREGVNFQNHCADLFHFDVPWNPSRMEQRNGRIDRKLQREDEVRCHYFVFPQRAEDKVLDALVRKTNIIQKELGSLSPVIQRNVDKLLETGIRHERTGQIVEQVEHVDRDQPRVSWGMGTVRNELEQATRKDRVAIKKQIARLGKLLETSQEWLQLDHVHFRSAVTESLRLVEAPGLEALDANAALDDTARARWVFPALDKLAGADPTWAATMDTLRAPRTVEQKPWEWRRDAPIRPVVFRDPGVLTDEVVHLHLEHRLVQRLLGRFLSQGFVHHDLSRACVCLTDDAVARVIVLGRLSLYGRNATRLHDEIIAVAAEWKDPDLRRGKLKPMTFKRRDESLALLERSLASSHLHGVTKKTRARLSSSAPQDVQELLPHLEHRAEVQTRRAEEKLAIRGRDEAEAMKGILDSQRKRILKTIAEYDEEALQEKFDYMKPELRQLRAERRHWEKRLESIPLEMESEPRRIRESYEVKATRVDAAGLVYLWPNTQ